MVDKKTFTKDINYKEIVLHTVLVTAVLSMAVMAPNALQVFGPLFRDKNKYPRKKVNYYIDKKTWQLLREGYLKWSALSGKRKLALTRKGMFELYKFKDVLLKKEKWDGNWRVIIFDIPMEKAKSRGLLRRCLKTIGFIQLQKSVWVYPYKCKEAVDLIREHFKVGKEVVYMVVKKIESDVRLKKHFKLK